MRVAIVLTFFTTLPLALAAGPEEQRGPLRLTLKRAVEIATSSEGNARIQISEENIKQAKARQGQARAALLPNVEGVAGLQNLNRSLAAQGLNEIELPFGIELPRRVGPFNVLDIRTSATQNVFDFSSIRRLQAAHAGVRATEADLGNTTDTVTAQTAKTYLLALRGDAEVETIEANIALAKAFLKQAQDQKAAGVGTGIDVTRAQVQLSTEQQRLLVAQNQRQKALLQLLRVMNLRLDTQLELTDRLSYAPMERITADEAKSEALKTRPDIKTQEERESTARLAASAVKYERLPSIVGYMDYGTTGAAFQSVMPTRTFSLGMRVPIFDGGRRDARRAETRSQYRQEQIRTTELREQIELDVRLALDSLQSAEEQVKVAEGAVKLAESELTQARRRYEAGVASSIEVADAQTRLERTRDNHIAALFNYNLARIDLGQAMGNTRRVID